MTTRQTRAHMFVAAAVTVCLFAVGTAEAFEFPPGDCTEYQNHSGWIPGWYDFGVLWEDGYGYTIVDADTYTEPPDDSWDKVWKCYAPATTTTQPTTTTVPDTTSSTTTTTTVETTTTTQADSTTTSSTSSTTTSTSTSTTTTSTSSTTTTLPVTTTTSGSSTTTEPATTTTSTDPTTTAPTTTTDPTTTTTTVTLPNTGAEAERVIPLAIAAFGVGLLLLLSAWAIGSGREGHRNR